MLLMHNFKLLFAVAVNWVLPQAIRSAPISPKSAAVDVVPSRRLGLLIVALVCCLQLCLATAVMADENGGDEAPSESSSQAIAASPSPSAPIEGTSNINWVVLVLALLAALGSSATALFVFRWRRTVGEGHFSVLPNVVVRQVEDLRRNQQAQRRLVNKASANMAKGAKQIDSQFLALSHSVGELNEIVGTLQRALDTRDAEIRRLRQGGDREVFRQYLSRLLRLERVVRAEAEDLRGRGGDPEPIYAVQEVLNDVLDDCGIEAFAPAVGAQLRDCAGIGDRPEAVYSDDPAKNLTIAEVLEPGFQLRTGDAPVILQEAKVRVFVQRTEEE